MRRRCAWMLMAVLLITMSVPEMAYATEEGTKTDEIEETQSGEGEESGTESEGPEAADIKESLEEQRKALQAALERSTFTEEDVIADGVYIDKIHVGGMTAEQALEAVSSYVEEVGAKKLTLTVEGVDDIGPIETTAAELGLYTNDFSGIVMEALTLGKGGNLIVRYKAEKDLQVSNQVYEIQIAVDNNRIEQFVTENTSDISVDPVSAELTRTSGGFSVSESKNGIEVDVPATVSEVQAAFQNWNRENVAMEAVVEIIRPRRTTELLSQIQEPIGKFTTENGDRSSGKLQNLQRGVDLTDGILLMPGDSWSMHDALAPFTASNGYTEQIAYQGTDYVLEYGGGICQLATTLYNAALRSEIKISKRFNHSMVVGYTIEGLDATINDEGSKDLELTNEFDFPVYIEAYHNGRGVVTYTIWGREDRPSNRTLKFTNNILSKETPEEQEVPNPELAPGERKQTQSAYPDMVVEAYKEVYEDGVLVDRTRLHTDTYKGRPRIVEVGPDAAIDPNTGLPVDSDPNAGQTTPPESEQPTQSPSAEPTPEAPTEPPTPEG